jgi:hypothetical protein
LRTRPGSVGCSGGLRADREDFLAGATAVQIVHSSHRGSRKIEHLGSAHMPEEVETLKAAARQRIEECQAELDLGLTQDACARQRVIEVGSLFGDLFGFENPDLTRQTLGGRTHSAKPTALRPTERLVEHEDKPRSR